MHDELLALINDEIKVCAPECMKHQWDNVPWVALRAVVELHKPNEHSSNKYCNCDEPWPCFTIQAIEKELEHSTES